MCRAVREIDVEQFVAERREDGAVVDVRPAEEFAAGHVPGAVNMPLGQVISSGRRVDIGPPPMTEPNADEQEGGLS